MVTIRHSLLILLLASLCLLTISQQHTEEESVAEGFIEGSASYPNNPDDEDSDSVEASAIPPADLKPAIPPENVEEKYTSPANKIVVPVNDDTTLHIEKDDHSTGVSILGDSTTPSALPTDGQFLSIVNILIIASIIVIVIVIAVSCYACRSNEKDGYTRGSKVGETI